MDKGAISKYIENLGRFDCTELILNLVFYCTGIDYPISEYKIYICLNYREQLIKILKLALNSTKKYVELPHLELIGSIWSSYMNYNVNIFSSDLFEYLIEVYFIYCDEFEEDYYFNHPHTRELDSIIELEAPSFYKCHLYVEEIYDELPESNPHYISSPFGKWNSFDEWCEARMDTWKKST